LIKRQQGQIAESLQLFQAATFLNPHNVANLKQVGRSLFVAFVIDSIGQEPRD
jgi:Bardet-Biedl syndrome 4 protein